MVGVAAAVVGVSFSNGDDGISDNCDNADEFQDAAEDNTSDSAEEGLRGLIPPLLLFVGVGVCSMYAFAFSFPM